jgi:hypothetical protein
MMVAEFTGITTVRQELDWSAEQAFELPRLIAHMHRRLVAKDESVP